MGRNLATNAHAIKGLEVVYVSDEQEVLAEKLGTELGTPYTSNYHELLADDRVQVVLITTSPTMRQIAADAAATGKYNFYGMDRNIPAEEIRHMLIEHLLPPGAFHHQRSEK